MPNLWLDCSNTIISGNLEGTLKQGPEAVAGSGFICSVIYGYRGSGCGCARAGASTDGELAIIFAYADELMRMPNTTAAIMMLFINFLSFCLTQDVPDIYINIG